MFNLSSEKNLLILIKIVPIIVIMLFSIVATFFALHESDILLEQKIKSIKQELIQKAKDRLQEEVTQVYNSILYDKSTTEIKLQQSLKQRVYEAHAIMENIYQKNASKPKDEIIQLIKNALDPIRFNNSRGYYFIYDMSGNNIMLPPAKHLEGTNFWNFKDAKEVYTIRGMTDVVKHNKEGFYNWYWYKPNDSKTQYKKVGFGKYFEPLNWFIGTGEYLKDYENDLQKDIAKKLSNIRFNEEGYVFLLNFDGVTLSHAKKSLIGKNTIDLKDPNGFMIVQEIIKTAKSNEGFIEYEWSLNPTTNKYRKKISFIKGFSEWNWALGTGFYLDTLNIEINKRTSEIKKAHDLAIKRIWFLSISLTLTFLILSLAMSYLVKTIFFNYKTSAAKKDQQLAEQAKLVAMGEMIGNIAHQWRQPLSVISTAASGMKMQQEANVLKEEDIGKYCDTINDNTQYLSTTIDDFRNFIKGDRVKKDFLLKDTIKSFLHLLEGTIKNSNISIITEIDESLKINSYQNELTQCLINIFNNSKDVLQEIKGRKYFFINIEKEEESNSAIIKLKDNGGGIPEDIIERVFEPYFTTKHKSQGTGLGLSMSYNLIANGMNGSLDVENITYEYDDKEYKGAEFIIVLPLN